jgi:hypothetical protein
MKRFAQMVDPDPEELKIAIRRVESAVFAFGGYVQSSTASIDQQQDGKDAPKTKSSIFRRLPLNPGTNGPQSDGSSSYHPTLRQRYVIKGNGISWEVEENSPIDLITAKSTGRMLMSSQKTSANNHCTTEKLSPDEVVDTNAMDILSDQGHADAPTSPSVVLPPCGTIDTPSFDRNQKMKYHCKLCGQPKQNHSCPFRSSLHRSIAISVVPVVNGYTAEEPGVLTPALSEMNNFVCMPVVAANITITQWMKLMMTMPPHITPCLPRRK